MLHWLLRRGKTVTWNQYEESQVLCLKKEENYMKHRSTINGTRPCCSSIWGSAKHGRVSRENFNSIIHYTCKICQDWSCLLLGTQPLISAGGRSDNATSKSSYLDTLDSGWGMTSGSVNGGQPILGNTVIDRIVSSELSSNDIMCFLRLAMLSSTVLKCALNAPETNQYT